MRRNLLLLAVSGAITCVPDFLFGAPKVSTLASVLIEKGYTPLTLKRAGNVFYVQCKLNGKSASLIVDTGASTTTISSGLLKSLGMTLTKGEANIYGAMGRAGKQITAGDIKDFQVGPYQAGAHPVEAWDFSYHENSGRSRALGSHLSSGQSTRMDGLLGIDFLHRHQAVIDCFRMHLFLKSPSAPSTSAMLGSGLKAGGCTEVPMRSSYRGLTVPVRINGRSGHMVVDTGASHTYLSQQSIAGLNMRLLGGTWTAAVDVGKKVKQVNTARFNTMEIGNFSVPQQSLGVVDFPHSKSSGAGDVFFGYLGQDLLYYYVAVVDCAALKLFLRFDPKTDAVRKRNN
jgi:predicted aspartyl protease